MPKEYVDHVDSFEGSSGEKFWDSRVRVGWNRETGYVQIATVTRAGEDNPEDISGRGVYVDLDRDQINRLIRILRRARDQSFGKDE